MSERRACRETPRPLLHDSLRALRRREPLARSTGSRWAAAMASRRTTCSRSASARWSWSSRHPRSAAVELEPDQLGAVGVWATSTCGRPRRVGDLGPAGAVGGSLVAAAAATSSRRSTARSASPSWRRRSGRPRRPARPGARAARRRRRAAEELTSPRRSGSSPRAAATSALGACHRAPPSHHDARGRDRGWDRAASPGYQLGGPRIRVPPAPTAPRTGGQVHPAPPARATAIRMHLALR